MITNVEGNGALTPLPLQQFINQIARMAVLHPNQAWASSMKEAAARLQEFHDIEEMLK